jgi:hypothetical protein
MYQHNRFLGAVSCLVVTLLCYVLSNDSFGSREGPEDEKLDVTYRLDVPGSPLIAELLLQNNDASSVIPVAVDLNAPKYIFIDNRYRDSLGEWVRDEVVTVNQQPLLISGCNPREISFRNQSGLLRWRAWLIDMDLVWPFCGERFYGIVGLPALKESCLRIDWDAKQWCIKPAADRASMKSSVRMKYNQNGMLLLPIAFGGVDLEVTIDAEIRLVDTCAVALPSQSFKALRDASMIVDVRPHFSTGGDRRLLFGHTQASVRDEAASGGGFECRDVLVGDINLAYVGLRFLRRYNWLFDFPNERIYFEPSNGCADPDPSPCIGGADCFRDSCGFVVDQIDSEGRMYHYGLRRGDRILEINGVSTERMPFITVQSALWSARPGTSFLVARSMREPVAKEITVICTPE